MEFNDANIGDLVQCIDVSQRKLVCGEIYKIVCKHGEFFTISNLKDHYIGDFYPKRFKLANQSLINVLNVDPDVPVILGAEYPDQIDWFAINKEFAAR